MDFDIVRRLTEYISDAVLYAGADGEVRYANAAWTYLTGRPAEAACGDGYLESFSAADRRQLTAAWDAARRSVSELTFAVRVAVQGGAPRPTKVHLTPLGEEAWLLVISELVPEQNFFRVADAMPQLMWMSDTAGSLQWVNKRWLDFTGGVLDLAAAPAFEDFAHVDDVDRLRTAWRTASAGSQAFECELRMVGRDGRARWFLSRAEPVVTARGVCWYGTNTDIDETRRASRSAMLFAEVGEALSGTLSLQATLDAIMRIAVPKLADWAFLTLSGDSGDLHMAKIAHPDPHVNDRLGGLVGRRYARGDAVEGSPAAMRAVVPLVVERATYEAGARVVEPDVFEELWRTGYTSGIAIPLVAGSTVRGLLTLLFTGEGLTLDAGDLPFYSELGRRIAPAIANAEVYERERRVAQSFQQAALPSTLPTSEGYIFSAVYEAGRSEALVGGDWYDAFKLLDGRFIVSIGDVAGSGLRAAVTMSNIRQAIRGVAHVHADPELMLEAADRALRSENSDFFATAFVGVVDPVANTIAYKSAGHPAALLTTLDGRVVELRTDGLPLGLREPDRTRAAVHALPPGAVLVLYTDGLTESTRDLAVGEASLREAVKRSRGSEPDRRAQTIHDAMLKGGSHDDVAILCMTAVPIRRRSWTVDVRDDEGTVEIRAEILAELRTHRESPDPSITAELVLAELIGNLVRYAPAPAEIALEWDAERAILHIRDEGPGFAFSPKLPNDIYSENGRGLYLIAELSEDFNVTRRPEGGSHARIVFTP